MMRKLNIVVIVGILLTVLCHILIGSFMLLGADNTIPEVLSCTALTLTGIHAVISSVLTVKTLRIRKKAGAGYFKENLMFWARRISGFAIIIPLVMHVVIFTGTTNGEMYRLVVFDIGRLISQLLFAATLLLHLVINLNPLLMGMGVRQHKGLSGDLCFVLSVVLLLASVGFLIYYIRWVSF